MLECGKNSTNMSIHLLVELQLHHLNHHLENCLGGAVDLLEIEAWWSQACSLILVAWAFWFGNLQSPNASSEGPCKALPPSWNDRYHQGQVLNFSGRLAHPAESWILVSAGVWLLEGVNSQQSRGSMQGLEFRLITKFQFCPVKTTSITVVYTNVRKRVCRDRILDLYIPVTRLSIRGFVLLCTIIARKDSDKIIDKPSALFCFVRQKVVSIGL